LSLSVFSLFLDQVHNRSFKLWLIPEKTKLNSRSGWLLEWEMIKLFVNRIVVLINWRYSSLGNNWCKIQYKHGFCRENKEKI